MPHSSGGGSHGGGSHGGSHGGSSGPHISTHYFPGARRYRRHYISTGRDEYVYADMIPQKSGISGIVIVSAMAAVFLGAFGMSVANDMPKKLGAHYMDMPAVHDEISVIKDDEGLEKTLTEYQELTGICTVVYTVYNNEWYEQYADLETYAYDTYVTNFKDEEHFVIVFSIPENEAGCYDGDTPYVPDYMWEAIQGDDTDPILTETMFKKFANTVQDVLEKGYDPGVAFGEAFAYAKRDASSKLNPTSPSRILGIFRSAVPFIIIAGVFTFLIITMVKQYKKDKDLVYEEVPLDTAGDAGIYQGSTGSIASSINSKGVPVALKVFYIIFMIPFVLAGIGMIIGGIFMLSNGSDKMAGLFCLGFGIMWSLILAATIFSLFRKGAKKNSENTAPLTAEYPKAEYPDVKPVQTDANPSSPFVPSPSQTEFDPAFFGSSKSNYEDDDEDYRRMKRQGFE